MGKLLRFQRFCLQRPKTCVLILHTILVLSALGRVLPAFGTMDRLILDNGWDDGRSFYNIMKHGYAPLPVSEYRELIGYPLAGRFAGIVVGQEPRALFVVSFISAAILYLLFFRMLRIWNLTIGEAFGGTVCFMTLRTPEAIVSFLPCWWPATEHLVAIEGSEPLFLIFVLLSYCWMERAKHALAGIALAVATLIRLPGSFIAFGAFMYLLFNKNWKHSLWYTLSPLVLMLHFGAYYLIRGDFFAFFHGSQQWYPNGVFSYPFNGLIQFFIQSKGLPGWRAWFALVCHIYLVVGMVILYRRRPMLFWLTLPQYLVVISLNGWSLLMRYYIVLWGVSLAYFLLILDWFRKRRPRESQKEGLDFDAPGSSLLNA